MYQIDLLQEQSNNARPTETTSSGKTIESAEALIERLDQALRDHDGRIADLRQTVKARQESTRWRLTRPLRFAATNLKRLMRPLLSAGVLLLNLRELGRIIGKVRNKGISSIASYSKLLQSPEEAARIARDRGLSPQFVKVLASLGAASIKIKQWWCLNDKRRECSERLKAFLLGTTAASRTPAMGHLRIHIDEPRRLFRIVGDSLTVSGWGANLDARTAAEVRVRLGTVAHPPYLQERGDVQRALFPICELPVHLGFAAVVSPALGLHRLWVDVKGPNGDWIPFQRTWLLRLPGLMAGRRRHSLSYLAWTRMEQRRLKAELPDIERHMDVMLRKPTFTLVIDARQGLDGWKQTLQSLRNQIYPHFELRVLASDGAALPPPLEESAKLLDDLSLADVSGDFVIFIEIGQSLSSDALYEFANAVNQDPELDLIYGDEDHLNGAGRRCDPFRKPDWSPDYLETFNYLAFPACFRTAIARGCFASANLYDLALQFTERTTKIRHVPRILGHTAHRPVDEDAREKAAARDIAALQGRLRRTGRRGTVYEHEMHRGCHDIRLDLKRAPLVSAIIPTEGQTVAMGVRQIDLITNVVEHIRERSTYQNIEIIVVDNGDLSQRQMQTLAEQGCKRISYTEPIVNLPKKMRLGASVASGEVFLFMHDDIEVLTPSWIERMLEHLEKPHVGVVGAKLLFPDGRTQHVGIVHNSGNPDHVRRYFPGNEAGYYFSTCGVRNFMAVSGAVLMTPASVFHEVGGYSEELAVSHGDADYCLKVRGKGFSVVYAPQAELTNLEAHPRVASADAADAAWYQKHWAPHIVSDPYYNEQFLTVAEPTFVPHVNQRLL